MIRKLTTAILILAVVTLGLTQCAKTFKNNITVQELQKKRQANPDLFILDVRTPGEYYKDGHIKGSKLIPINELTKRLGEIKDKKDKEIYVICHSGSRSVSSSIALDQLGFTKIYNVLGGMSAWKRNRFPIAKGKS
ncbi:MAG TPA: rhodanese-like domain-containing protein [Spirochaetes bacterium]|mgnify:CR=1 FL=1|nr:rhodanese-like domain-containing protein [Spirochaetota bacterium]